MTTLVIADHDHGHILPATLNAITAAMQLGSEVHVLVAGHQAQATASAASRIQGVAKVLHADAPALAHGLAEPLADQVLALCRPYSHLVFAATASGKNTAPRVAAALDVAQVSEVTRVLSPDTFQRPIYAGSVIATVKATDAVKVLTVRSTAFEAAPGSEQAAPIEAVAATPDQAASACLGRHATASDRPDLSTAKVVVAGGRALGSAAQFEALLTPLADKLGAALGASRAAVDAGYAPNELQVGQTGKIVAPQLYMAVGISGAIQHLAGMKDAKLIVAVNKDPEAPIFQVADVGLEADLFEALPALAAGLTAAA
jgi:electron transfer flavoprotein alpha subunit